MSFSIFTDLITPTSYSLPNAPNINLDTLGTDTVAGNAATFAGAKQLASDYNDFYRQQVAKSLQQGVPGFSNITQQLSSNLQSQLGGQLSSSDAAASQRNSAARALGLGIAGSQAGAAFTARNLGLSQYQVQQNAQQQAPGYLATVAGLTRSPTFDPASMFLSPMQRAQLSWQNQTAAFNVQNLKNQMAAQPPGWERALAGAGDSLVNAVAAYYGLGGGGPSPTSQGGGFNSFGGGGSGLQGIQGFQGGSYYGSQVGGSGGAGGLMGMVGGGGMGGFGGF